MSRAYLIETLWWTHWGFDVKRTNVLPVFLQQRHQEVDWQVNILGKFVRIHFDVSNGNWQTQDLIGRKNEYWISFFKCMLSKFITFFIWNLIVALTSSIFDVIDSEWASRPGNLPALFKPGPNNLGICLINDSDAKKASYFLANFLTNFLFLFNFFKASASMNGTSLAFASSQCCWSPKIHTCILGRGMYFNLK